MYTSMAFDLSLFGIPFDKYLHFMSSFALGLVFFQFFYFRAHHVSIYTVVFLSVLATVGLGSVVEMAEFMGYALGGHGDGVFFYGTGDSLLGGEWADASTDMIANFIGALLAAIWLIIAYYFLPYDDDDEERDDTSLDTASDE